MKVINHQSQEINVYTLFPFNSHLIFGVSSKRIQSRLHIYLSYPSPSSQRSFSALSGLPRSWWFWGLSGRLFHSPFLSLDFSDVSSWLGSSHGSSAGVNSVFSLLHPTKWYTETVYHIINDVNFDYLKRWLIPGLPTILFPSISMYFVRRYFKIM